MDVTSVPVGTIERAAAAPEGSLVEVTGVIAASRQLGRVTFVVVEDPFSEMQVVAEGEPQRALRRGSGLCATVVGVLQQRPARDRRPDKVNGTLEIRATAARLHHHHGGLRAVTGLENALRFATLLQSLGFVDVRTLAQLLAPSYLALGPTEELEIVRHITQLVAPCRWYFLTPDDLYFGLTPGTLADLRGWLAAADGRELAGVILESASWQQEPASGDPAAPPAALGVLRLPDASGYEQATLAAYWRRRHDLLDLPGPLIEAAATPPHADDVAIQALQEGISRTIALLEAALDASSAPRSIALRDLPAFDLGAEHMAAALALFPSLERRLSASTPEQQLELMWSIFGHDNVKAVFSSPESVELLAACVRAGLVPDYGVLRCIDPAALRSMRALTDGFTDAGSLGVIRRLTIAAPNALASACYLMERLWRAGLRWERCEAVATRGLIGAVSFAAAALELATPKEIAAWRRQAASASRCLYTNEPVDEAAVRSVLASSAEQFGWMATASAACEDLDPVFDLVHLTFGSGLVAYEEAAALYRRARCCADHWENAGIELGGRRWNPAERRFDLDKLQLYPSKNRAAILAKSCSGICSARDEVLFHREDYFQFTLVEPSGPSAVGSVQMYRHRDDRGRPIWVARGLNPSEKVAVDRVGFTVEILDTLAGLARCNGVGALVYADGGDLFNADSGRVSLRTVLRRMAGAATPVLFDAPLALFDYHGRQISIESGWQLWP